MTMIPGKGLRVSRDVLRYDYDRLTWIRNGIVLPCRHLGVPRADCRYCYATERVAS